MARDRDRASGCTSSPARAAPARPPSPPRWPSRWPPGAGGCCSSRSRGGRASPALRRRRRCPTRSAGSRAAPRRRRGLRRSPSTPRRRCWSTSTCSTSSAAPAGRWRSSAPSTSPPPSRRACATSCSPARSRRRSTRSATGRAGAVYDAVVLDAPPTGRIGRFLNVTAEVRRAGQGRPDQDPDRRVMAVLRSPQTAVHVVTLLEEMPVQETATRSPSCERSDLPVGGVIVNAVRDADPARRGADGAARATSSPTRTSRLTWRRRVSGRPDAAGRRPAGRGRRPRRARWRWSARRAPRLAALGRPTYRAAVARRRASTSAASYELADGCTRARGPRQGGR